MTEKQKAELRSIPSISQLLEHERIKAWLEKLPRTVVVEALQSAVDTIRRTLLKEAGREQNVDARDHRSEAIGLAHEKLLSQSTSSLRRVVNATGVVLHTGLGRAPLCTEAIRAVTQCASSYSNLELDLATGNRGHRAVHVAGLLAEITGAEAATVVNNNAAATLLILNTLANGCEVIVSRGQLVEIGGSYRLPEMMAASGARLREVGTTNRTRISDYEQAINDNTAALMRVHTSNYRVVGFSEETAIEQLTALGHKHNKLIIDDLGSGALFDLGSIGLPSEPDVATSIAAQSDVICFSGDKLLGGPQAGLILGRREIIRRIEANPLMRTYRVDKLTLAALEATLRQYRDPKHASATIPSLALTSTPISELRQKARKLCRMLRAACPTDSFEVVSDWSVAGGGSLPLKEIETRCVAWSPKNRSVEDTLTALRSAAPPIVARAKSEQVVFDVRTLLATDLQAICAAVADAGCSE